MKEILFHLRIHLRTYGQYRQFLLPTHSFSHRHFFHCKHNSVLKLILFLHNICIHLSVYRRLSNFFSKYAWLDQVKNSMFAPHKIEIFRIKCSYQHVRHKYTNCNETTYLPFLCKWIQILERKKPCFTEMRKR